MMFPNKALGELPLEIIDGDRGANYPKTNEFSPNGHCLFLNAGNVSSRGFSFSDTAFISSEKDQLLRKGKAKRNDVILTTRGTVGNLALYDDSVPFAHIRINSGMVLLRPDKAALDPEFLYYALRSPAFSKQVVSLQTGSAQPQLPIRDIRHLRIPFPDLEQQKAVSQRVKLIFDKIELNRRMNETLEQMARALFRDWFVDFGPTRRQADGATDPAAIMGHVFPPEKATTLAPLFPSRLGDDGLPESWSWGEVSDLADLNPKSWTAKKHPDAVQYVDLSNTKWGRIEETTNYDWSDAPSRARRVLEIGDTIVGTVRPGNGSFSLVGRKGLTGSTGFAVLRPKQEKLTELVYLALTSPENIESLANLADGGAYPAINPKVVAATKVALADSAVVGGFSQVTQSMFEKRHANEEESQTLAEMRDLLLPQLMSGEIRLKDAEASV